MLNLLSSSSDLEEMFQCKNEPTKRSSKPDSNLFSNIASQQLYDATVACVAAHRAKRRKRAPARDEYIKKMYASDPDSNCKIDDKSHSKRHCTELLCPSNKVKDYLSSVRRKLDFSADGFTDDDNNTCKHNKYSKSKSFITSLHYMIIILYTYCMIVIYINMYSNTKHRWSNRVSRC